MSVQDEPETPAPPVLPPESPAPQDEAPTNAPTDDAPTEAASPSLAPASPVPHALPVWRRALGLFALGEEIGWRDHVVGLLIGAIYVAWLLTTTRSLGFARDEGFYFQAGGDYWRWFETLLKDRKQAFDPHFIDSIWGENHEHPALMKSLFGLSWALFHEKWKLFSDASTAFRFPGMVMAGLGSTVTYLFGARAGVLLACRTPARQTAPLRGRLAGVIAAVLLMAMPHVFYNAHLACFDVPIMTMWLASVYVYHRAETTRKLWLFIAAGVVYGLALETKHNAWILPAVFVPHAFLLYGDRLRRAGRRVLFRAFPWSLVSMALLGPAIFRALWPWMWNDFVPRLTEYFEFHWNHVYYNIEYLGKNYYEAPSPPSYAPVLVLATVPSITLLLFGIGVFARLRATGRELFVALFGARAPTEEHDAVVAVPPDELRILGDRVKEKPPRVPVPEAPAWTTDLLLLLAFSAPLAVFFLPKTPIFGGTKHWFPAYPFLALFAGVGFVATAEALIRAFPSFSRGDRRLAVLSLAGLVVLGPLAITAHSHPFGLSSYVPLVGGTAGGADLGLNRQFWGYTTESLDAYFREHTRPGTSVFLCDTTWQAWDRMQKEKRIPAWLQASGAPGQADLSIVHHELHFNEVDDEIWIAYGHTDPDYVLTHDGVPIVSVYKRR